MSSTSTAVQALVLTPLFAALAGFIAQGTAATLAKAFPRTAPLGSAAARGLWLLAAAAQAAVLWGAMYAPDEALAWYDQQELGAAARALRETAEMSKQGIPCTPEALATAGQGFMAADGVLVVLLTLVKPAPAIRQLLVGVWLYSVVSLTRSCGEPAVEAIFLPPPSPQMLIIVVLYFLAPYVDPIEKKKTPFLVLYGSALCAAFHPMLA